MSNPLSRLATRAAYGATQLPRVAWYVGHGLAMRTSSKKAGGTYGQLVEWPRPVVTYRRMSQRKALFRHGY